MAPGLYIRKQRTEVRCSRMVNWSDRLERELDLAVDALAQGRRVAVARRREAAIESSTVDRRGGHRGVGRQGHRVLALGEGQAVAEVHRQLQRAGHERVAQNRQRRRGHGVDQEAHGENGRGNAKDVALEIEVEKHLFLLDPDDHLCASDGGGAASGKDDRSEREFAVKTHVGFLSCFLGRSARYVLSREA